MSLSHNQLAQVRAFYEASDFHNCGWILTDLDGTAVHEFQGRVSLPEAVKQGLGGIYGLGRPVVINTLRFPLSVMNVFGRDWYHLANAEIPTVLLNGSLLGYIALDAKRNLSYRELAAFPLSAGEIDVALARVEATLTRVSGNVLVFYYPRDWRKGELIWTPVEDRKEEVKAKYRSASAVFSGSLAALRDRLHSEPVCMIFVLLELAKDQLMAYQHAHKNSFYTHAGINKLSGARAIAKLLGLELEHAIGAGDTEMDTFLEGVGLPVYVGHQELPFRALRPPLRLPSSAELGELLHAVSSMERKAVR